MSSRWLVALPPLAFAALAGLFLLGMQRENPDELPSAAEGRRAPALTVIPLGGAPLIDAAVLSAPGVKLVNFWASWCAPCRAEHPILSELAAEGLPVHGVNYKDKPAQALAFLADLGDPYATQGADDSGRTGLDWGLYGVPETFVIDGDGVVVLRFAGPITRQELERRIRPAIAAAAE
jgi:cytochrome c biogenesis protein CcmG/thiol:disulfide interchange protein DsbE